MYRPAQQMPLYKPIPKKSLSLLASQVEHFDRLCDILRRTYGYVDVSVMGLGKTYVLAAIAAHFGLPFFVIGKSEVPWKKLVAEFDVPQYRGFMTTNAMAGSTNHGISHKWLTMTLRKTEKQTTVRYNVTNEWMSRNTSCPIFSLICILNNKQLELER